MCQDARKPGEVRWRMRRRHRHKLGQAAQSFVRRRSVCLKPELLHIPQAKQRSCTRSAKEKPEARWHIADCRECCHLLLYHSVFSLNVDQSSLLRLRWLQCHYSRWSCCTITSQTEVVALSFLRLRLLHRGKEANAVLTSDWCCCPST